MLLDSSTGDPDDVLSEILGAVDYKALMEGRPQNLVSNPNGKYMLFRVCDAVACRNIHAALYDSLRLCKDFQAGDFWKRGRARLNPQWNLSCKAPCIEMEDTKRDFDDPVA